MPFAIELLFDRVSDAAIRRVGRLLERHHVPTSFSIPGSSPHFALAVFGEYEPKGLLTGLNRIAASTPILPFHLSSLGTFPGKEGALFLAPAVTPELLRLHSRVHRLTRRLVQNDWAHYVPGRWIPHCTVGINLSRTALERGFKEIQRTDFSIKGKSTKLVLVEFRPVIEVFAARLAGKKARTK